MLKFLVELLLLLVDIQQFDFQIVLHQRQFLLGLFAFDSAFLLDLQRLFQRFDQILLRLFERFDIDHTPFIFFSGFDG